MVYTVRVHSPLTSAEFTMPVRSRRAAALVVDTLKNAMAITKHDSFRIEVEQAYGTVVWANYYGRGPANDKPWPELIYA